MWESLGVIFAWLFANLAKIITFLGFTGGLILLLLRSRFVTRKEFNKNDFVTQEEFNKHLNAYNDRMDEVEDRMATLATHQDVKNLSDILNDIRQQTTETATKSDMTQEALRQVNNSLALLTRAAIERDK